MNARFRLLCFGARSVDPMLKLMLQLLKDADGRLRARSVRLVWVPETEKDVEAPDGNDCWPDSVALVSLGLLWTVNDV